MTKLEQLREKMIKELGEEAPIIQELNRQIMAEKSGQSFKDLYITGSYTIPKVKSSWLFFKSLNQKCTKYLDAICYSFVIGFVWEHMASHYTKWLFSANYGKPLPQFAVLSRRQHGFESRRGHHLHSPTLSISNLDCS